MITITVGVILRGQIRKGLEILKFEDEIEAFPESKGLFESEFRIKGASGVAIRRMRYWQRQIEQE